MTFEEFKERTHFSPSFREDERTKEPTVRMVIWYNPTGDEIYNSLLMNPHEKFKDVNFYSSDEWMMMKPEFLRKVYESILFFK